jgi:hypothetical protein
VSIELAIKLVILNGGTVSVPIKLSLSDWVQTVIISQSYIFKTFCVNNQYKGMDTFDDLDKAIEAFVKSVYTKKNMALALIGIKVHRLSDKEYDDLKDNELRILIKKYNDEYFDTDYPFVSQST